jgi:1,2-diacylglycerol 3-alpha-glucosyltransferase
MRVGILTEFPSLSIQSGPALQTRFLHDGLSERGHSVALIGPDTSAQSSVASLETYLFANASFRHGPSGGRRYPERPTVNVPMPWPPRRFIQSPSLDVVHGQSASQMMQYGAWLRRLHGTAFINTHMIHLPAQIHFLIPSPLYEISQVRDRILRAVPRLEQSFAKLYNRGDGLVVQNERLVKYWHERGVHIPIEVIGRPVNPKVFSRATGDDPFPRHAKPGKRLLCVCRVDREKNLDPLIDMFDREIAGADPEATLTLIGDGFERRNLIERSGRSQHADRYFFPGEVKHDQLRSWYDHADVFVYTSLSETFGNVVNEALWNGLPVVAFNDDLGVAGQVQSSFNGFLIEPYSTSTSKDFAAAVLRLLRNDELRRRLAHQAKRAAQRASHPDTIFGRYERFYEQSIRRAQREVSPLSKAKGAARAAKAVTFASHIGPWACWNSFIVGLGLGTVALGIGGTGGSTELGDAIAAIEEEARLGAGPRLRDAAE